MRALYIALGAGVGACGRFILDSFIKKLHSHWLPLETLLINVVGSFVLGLVINTGGHVSLMIGTGFAGAFTTWSTLAVEAHALVHTKSHGKAFTYLLLTLICGISAAALGVKLAS
jgi:CrcB protein